MAGKFELYTDKSGEYRFRLKAGNGEVIAISEGYSSKSAALNGIDSVRRNAADAEVVEATDLLPRFTTRPPVADICGRGVSSISDQSTRERKSFVRGCCGLPRTSRGSPSSTMTSTVHEDQARPGPRARSPSRA